MQNCRFVLASQSSRAENFLVRILKIEENKVFFEKGTLFFDFAESKGKSQCLQIFLRLDAIAEWLREQKYFHGDIKPENIIFIENSPKLIDLSGEFACTHEKKPHVPCTPAFQPRQPSKFSREELDRFSILVTKIEAFVFLFSKNFFYIFRKQRQDFVNKNLR
jgi:serine/threonine protein kinase